MLFSLTAEDHGAQASVADGQRFVPFCRGLAIPEYVVARENREHGNTQKEDRKSTKRHFYPLMMFFNKKNRFAGRSASRRVRYGNQWAPNGIYTRTFQPSAQSERCKSRRIP